MTNLIALPSSVPILLSPGLVGVSAGGDQITQSEWDNMVTLFIANCEAVSEITYLPFIFLNVGSQVVYNNRREVVMTLTETDDPIRVRVNHQNVEFPSGSYELHWKADGQWYRCIRDRDSSKQVTQRARMGTHKGAMVHENPILR
jgi:hypothetical protein